MNNTNQQHGCYPRRPNHFAHKFVRLLFKACVAQEIGQEAVILLAFVAHTEDAKHYRSPVTFFNGQLLGPCGFTREHTLIKARDRAIRAGWLHYEPGKKGIAGTYWVLIPPVFLGIDDLPSDENFEADFPDENVSESVSESATFPDENVSESVGKASGKAEGKRQGKRRESVSHSSLYLSPTPSPTQKEETPLTPLKGGTIEFPANLDTAEFRGAWSDLEAYRREQKLRPWKSRTIAAKLAEMSGWGHDAAILAIRNTIANGWQGVFHPSRNGGAGEPREADNLATRAEMQRQKNARLTGDA